MKGVGTETFLEGDVLVVDLLVGGFLWEQIPRKSSAGKVGSEKFCRIGDVLREQDVRR